MTEGNNNLLKSYVERYKQLTEEKKQNAELTSELLQEAKSTGLDTKNIKDIVNRMMMDAEKLKKLKFREAERLAYAESIGQLGLFS